MQVTSIYRYHYYISTLLSHCKSLQDSQPTETRRHFFLFHICIGLLIELNTADVGWQSIFPLPLNPPRTHSRLYHHMCLRTDGQ